MSKRTAFPLLLGAVLGLSWAMRRKHHAARAAEWALKTAGQPGTAVITGASAGIGAAFARALAREGYHLVLLARREDRLRALAAELEQQYGIRVETLAVDLAAEDGQTRAAARIAEIPDVSLLVNNAGFGTGAPFSAVPVEPELKMISLHIAASVRLTRAALPGMIERGRGGVIQVSSVAGLAPMPGTVTYGSTKAYLNFFTQALNAELHGSGVRVQALCPGFTLSEFHDAAGISRSIIPGFLWMKAEDVVRESLEGLREGCEIVVPGRLYRLLARLLRLPFTLPIARQVQRARLHLR